ncbi:elongation factor P [Candidatus Woesebacteria bacterium RBG_13_34_9]|uniref:Elongation factor P n=1 Tax=Candidatus Woesebacteria bacterium RBG_13_34_9 TaxID=1802477 RepID=A0A1F7X0N6_9BACT|nr:MAG: elongation factor P [Candidatus Woesebacteria bacterium RBG_13_34_9]
MINATDLKNGVTFLSEGQPFKVIKYSHIKVGRGGAIVRVNVRNLVTQAVTEKTYSANVKVEEVEMSKQKLQYLYNDGRNALFMNPKTFEQVEIPQNIIKQELPYVKEGEEATVLFWGDKPLSIDIPPKVVLRIKDTPPGVKGNSATNVYKQAILENGMSVRVPLFIDNNQRIVVDTRNGEYVERAKD